jgi:hypothetical protein
MNTKRFYLTRALLVTAALATLATRVKADPLPGRDKLKFDQQPMLATNILDYNGTVQTYYGHDELSTAYGFPNAIGTTTTYDGRFMADDFADNFSTPVLHVKWWGSYLGNFINPKAPVNKFLISFESDQPSTSVPPTFSTPGQPLLNQVLNRASGPLTPGSGTFTEKLVQPATPGSDAVYEYNGELDINNAFPEAAGKVYWLKIAAMVDVPPGIQFPVANPPAAVTKWGWHNRDYTIQDALASPVPIPGETQVGVIGGNNTPVYHFQDDAVTGDVHVDVSPPLGTALNPFIHQAGYLPTFYVDGLDGPGSSAAPGISHFSKDLAFQLFTQVPEPSTCLLLLSGGIGLGMLRRRFRRPAMSA